MKYPKIPVFFMAAAITASPLAGAGDYDDEEPFEEARLFFELNDTDGDLGIHGKIDGDEWKYLEIEDPRDRKMLNLWVRGRLRRQGLTELFFESAEPTFDELDPEKFFRRFPEGEYDIEGYTLDGEERESEVFLSHVIPAAPDDVTINGTDAPENCDEDLPVVADAADGVTLEWSDVTQSHWAKHGPGGDVDDQREFALGDDGIIDVRYYEVVVEIDESDFKSSSLIPGDETEWEIPGGFFELAEGEEPCPIEGDMDRVCAEYKFEILVRTNVYDGLTPIMVELEEGEMDNLPGNKSAIESCFLVPAEAEIE